MNNYTEEKIIHLMDMNMTPHNVDLTNKVISKMENNVEYILTKLEILKSKLLHIKGYITLSSNRDNIKITYDKESVSGEIRKEFFEICDKWLEKYKIKAEYDFSKEVLYIK